MSPLCSVAHLWELRGSFGFVPHVIQHRTNKKIKKLLSLTLSHYIAAETVAPTPRLL